MPIIAPLSEESGGKGSGGKKDGKILMKIIKKKS